MFQEGSIVQTYMLTKQLCQTPIAELYQAIHVDSGERFLLKIARPSWMAVEGNTACSYFQFEPGLARVLHPDPSELLDIETMILRDLAGENLPFAKPLSSDVIDGIRFTVYEFFEGEALQTHIKERRKFNTMTIGILLRHISRLHAKGLFHGNLQPTSILIGHEDILLLDPGLAFTEFDSPERNHLVRTLTCPTFYPLLDPRNDQIALGFLLYYFFTQKHPLEIEGGVGQNVRRRFSPRLLEMINEARERGANRYLMPLAGFNNPSQVRRKTAGDPEELILKTIGIQRVNSGSDDEMLDVSPDSWLDFWLDPYGVNLRELWTFDKCANTFHAILNHKIPVVPVVNPAEEFERNRSDADKATT
jgi:serine/threonine protein kinase